MKILVTSTPGLGHVIPLVPLAQAFVRQGHEVRWATGVERHTTYRIRYPERVTLQPQELPAHMFPRLFGEISRKPPTSSTNATAGAASGASLELSPQDTDRDRVAAAISTLLSDGTYIENARRGRSRHRGDAVPR